MSRTKKLTFLTAGYTQVSTVFPFVVVSPAYFAGAIQLGGLMQTASAFGSVQNALSFFINVYRDAGGVARGDRPARRLRRRHRAARRGGRRRAVDRGCGRRRPTPSAIDDLLLRLPQGMPLVAADDIAIAPGDRVLVTGPSGTGKSTLFRAIAGIWPFGDGTVTIPTGAKLMMLPQRPYFPVGTLAAAVSYPAEPGTFGDERLAETHRGRRAAGARQPARTRRRTGTGCCRSASSSGSASRARCCRRRTSCSSTRPPRRSTSRRKPTLYG